MVGDPEILEAALPRRFGHRLERFGAVRRGRMAVKYAAQVFVADELWQRVLRSFFYLVPAFAQLGLDKLQVQRFIDVFLCCRSDKLLAAIKAIGLEVEAFVAREFLQKLKMRRRSGCVQQACAKVLFVGDRRDSGRRNYRVPMIRFLPARQAQDRRQARIPCGNLPRSQRAKIPDARCFTADTACSSSAAALCRCSCVSPLRAMERFCRIFVCSAAPRPLTLRMRSSFAAASSSASEVMPSS